MITILWKPHEQVEVSGDLTGKINKIAEISALLQSVVPSGITGGELQLLFRQLQASAPCAAKLVQQFCAPEA